MSCNKLFFRLGPHFTLTFLFYEQMKRMSLIQANKKYLVEQDKNLQNILAVYDSNNNGKLDRPELVEILKQEIPRGPLFSSEEAYERALIMVNNCYF